MGVSPISVDHPQWQAIIVGVINGRSQQTCAVAAAKNHAAQCMLDVSLASITIIVPCYLPIHARVRQLTTDTDQSDVATSPT